ncbi:MAG: cbb3-type cytochrome oxidase assembly protein CcoS [Candidatus Hydrogenedentes bacterium]|nr:cbb3-type cytochrome oxidase assembly protein CcoS [Candidatus Hydrogenedentota bacterium]
MTPEAAILWVVLSFSVITVCMALPFAWWAIKSGQFRNQDRARYLALEVTPPAGRTEATKHDL